MRQVAISGFIAAAWGEPISPLLTRYLRDELFDVTYHDPWSFAVAGLVTFLAIAVAAYFPVRRAVTVDPDERCGRNSETWLNSAQAFS